MNTLKMAKEYLHWAQRYLLEAERALNEKAFPTVIRRSQESLELSTKALLRFLGIEYPREHDVSLALSGVREKLPKSLQKVLRVWKKLLRDLARDRGPAFYGFESENIPPGQIFTGDYAQSVLTQVQILVALISDFIEQNLTR